MENPIWSHHRNRWHRISEGTSSVVELRDPTAHAKVMALCNAGKALGRHLFEDAVMYASSEPCPMCLSVCYWARLPRLVFGATTYDVATSGFEDLQFYRELARDLDQRAIQEQGERKTSVAGPLRYFARGLKLFLELLSRSTDLYEGSGAKSKLAQDGTPRDSRGWSTAGSTCRPAS
jgi:tRNA(Arg) A34 adenosine deaminase TadA